MILGMNHLLPFVLLCGLLLSPEFDKNLIHNIPTDWEKSVPNRQGVKYESESKCKNGHEAYVPAAADSDPSGNGRGSERYRIQLFDVRVVHKDDDVILRVKDDCIPFDPHERQGFVEGDDIIKNIGIRMVFRIARDVRYQNILGLNVLTIRI